MHTSHIYRAAPQFACIRRPTTASSSDVPAKVLDASTNVTTAAAHANGARRPSTQQPPVVTRPLVSACVRMHLPSSVLRAPAAPQTAAVAA
jgi:hypothetical protein